MAEVGVFVIPAAGDPERTVEQVMAAEEAGLDLVTRPFTAAAAQLLGVDEHVFRVVPEAHPRCHADRRAAHGDAADADVRTELPAALRPVHHVRGFGGKPVKELQYSAYNPRALRSMLSLTQGIRERHGLQGIAMVHRLGTVPIGEESILIAVSAPHRQAAWRAAEEALEECKTKVEIWKREEFEGEEGVWRTNRDGAAGSKVNS